MKVKWNNVFVALLAGFTILIGTRSCGELKDLNQATEETLLLTLGPDSTGIITLAMILTTLVTIIKLLTQNKK